jgi:hypothetical protein
MVDLEEWGSWGDIFALSKRYLGAIVEHNIRRT